MLQDYKKGKQLIFNAFPKDLCAPFVYFRIKSLEDSRAKMIFVNRKLLETENTKCNFCFQVGKYFI